MLWCSFCHRSPSMEACSTSKKKTPFLSERSSILQYVQRHYRPRKRISKTSPTKQRRCTDAGWHGGPLQKTDRRVHPGLVTDISSVRSPKIADDTSYCTSRIRVTFPVYLREIGKLRADPVRYLWLIGSSSGQSRGIEVFFCTPLPQHCNLPCPILRLQTITTCSPHHP
jgi:hypothetical protein